MSRLSVTTVLQAQAKKTHGGQASDSGPLRVLILGDYSGRSNIGDLQVDRLLGQRLYQVDKDTFDDVFSALKVKIKSPVSDEYVVFSDLDDMHPDSLYENLSIFEQYRITARKIKNSKTFLEAVNALEQLELRLASGVAPVESAVPLKNTSTPKPLDTLKHTETSAPDFSFDDILKSQDNPSVDEKDFIQHIISDAVKPFAIPKQDQRIDGLLEALWESAGQLMRGVMQHPSFKGLESRWRALDLLNRRLDTDRECHLFIFDLNHDELSVDFKASPWDQSVVRQCITGTHKAVPTEPFDVVVLTDGLNASRDHNILDGLSNIVKEMGGVLFVDADLNIVGCEELLSTPQAELWPSPDTMAEQNSAFQNWNAARRSGCAESVFAFSPPFLQRLPYGTASPIDAFPFYECTDDELQENLLWGSAACLAVIIVSQVWNFGRETAGIQINNLPFFVAKSSDEDVIQPPTKVVFTDKTINRLKGEGVNTFMGSIRAPNITLRSLVPIKSI